MAPAAPPEAAPFPPWLPGGRGAGWPRCREGRPGRLPVLRRDVHLPVQEGAAGDVRGGGEQAALGQGELPRGVAGIGSAEPAGAESTLRSLPWPAAAARRLDIVRHSWRAGDRSTVHCVTPVTCFVAQHTFGGVLLLLFTASVQLQEGVIVSLVLTVLSSLFFLHVICLLIEINVIYLLIEIKFISCAVIGVSDVFK